jgi:hypothetical protein
VGKAGQVARAVLVRVLAATGETLVLVGLALVVLAALVRRPGTD